MSPFWVLTFISSLETGIITNVGSPSYSVSCTSALPTCISDTVVSSIQWTVSGFRSFPDNFYAGQLQGGAYFQFKLLHNYPLFQVENIYKSNTANAFLVVTFTSVQIVSCASNPSIAGTNLATLNCWYQGSGISNPQTATDIANAQIYVFSYCDFVQASLQAQDEVKLTSSSTMVTSILGAGNPNPGHIVEVRAILNSSNPCVPPGIISTPSCTTSTVYPTLSSTDSSVPIPTTSNVSSPSDSNIETPGSSWFSFSGWTLYGTIGAGIMVLLILASLCLFAINRHIRINAKMAAIRLSSLSQNHLHINEFHTTLDHGTPKGNNKEWKGKGNKKLDSIDADFDNRMQIERPTSFGSLHGWRSSDNLQNNGVSRDFDDLIMEIEGRDRAATFDGSSLEQLRRTMKRDKSSSNNVLKQENATATEMTLMDNRALGLSMPGFLMLDSNKDFRLEKIISEGGGGIIYLAELLDDQLKRKHRVRKVVVKMVKDLECWSKEETLNSFRQEVSVMWTLSYHKNIIKLIGFTEEPKSIVMQQYQENLQKILHDREHFQLFPEIMVSFSKDIASALAEMHKMGIAHRDLKPTNCLIEKLPAPAFPSYNLVVCDFGLARVDAALANTVKGYKSIITIGLSTRYAAPEIFSKLSNNNTTSSSSSRESSIEYDMYSDVYAYGVCVWELIERKEPWQGLHPKEIENRVRRGERPDDYLNDMEGEFKLNVSDHFNPLDSHQRQINETNEVANNRPVSPIVSPTHVSRFSESSVHQLLLNNTATKDSRSDSGISKGTDNTLNTTVIHELRILMKRAWEQSPEARITFAEAVVLLSKLWNSVIYKLMKDLPNK